MDENDPTMRISTFSCQELCCWWNEKRDSKSNFEEKVKAEQKVCSRELCAQTPLGNHGHREKETRRQQRAEEQITEGMKTSEKHYEDAAFKNGLRRKYEQKNKFSLI